CALSVGSDTGGSVRQPAALCGVFGFKATAGVWPLDGVFPLSPTFDSIGMFAHSAEDAAIAFAALTGTDVPGVRPPQGVRLGRPANHYFEGLSAEVGASVAAALDALDSAGVEIVSMEVPEAAETNDVLVPMMPVELLAHLGTQRVAAGQSLLDPIVWSRLHAAFEASAVDYVRRRNRQQVLRQIAVDRMQGLDGWITPTTFDTAVPVDEYRTVEKAVAWTHQSTRNTRPGNLFGQCGISIPIPTVGGKLPTAIQIMCKPGHDAELLSVSRRIEQWLPRPDRPDLKQFL
ncbi:MAG: amidase, partial [Xanthobacteraceae bacterium]|nr:amidase [Xanthobacteraceae bacterium]